MSNNLFPLDEKSFVDRILRGFEVTAELGFKMAALKEVVDEHKKILRGDGNGESSLMHRMIQAELTIERMEKIIEKRDILSEEEIKGKWSFRTKLVEGIPGAIAGAAITGLIYLFKRIFD